MKLPVAALIIIGLGGCIEEPAPAPSTLLDTPDVGAEVGPDVSAEVGPDVSAEVGPDVSAEVGSGCAGLPSSCSDCLGDVEWSQECEAGQWVCTSGQLASTCPGCPCCNVEGQDVPGGFGCAHPQYCTAWDRSEDWCQPLGAGHPATMEGTTVAYGAASCSSSSGWFSGTTTLVVTGTTFTLSWSDSGENVAGTAAYDPSTGALTLNVEGAPPAGFDGEGTVYGEVGSSKAPIIVDMALGAPTGEASACAYTIGAPPSL